MNYSSFHKLCIKNYFHVYAAHVHRPLTSYHRLDAHEWMWAQVWTKLTEMPLGLGSWLGLVVPHCGGRLRGREGMCVSEMSCLHSGPRDPKFPAEEVWENNLTSLRLSFPAYNVEMIIVANSQGWCEDSMSSCSWGAWAKRLAPQKHSVNVCC